MAVSVQTLIDSKYAEAAQTFQYVVDANTTVVIDKFTATNVSASNASISINLVDSGFAGNSNLIVDARKIAPGETYTCPELTTHVLQSGAGISTLASAGSAITIRASGRVIT